MSASTTINKQSMAMPVKTKKIMISDPIQMPEIYSSTPGGTLYSTTPGGTKLIYEQSFLKELRNSPLSKSPPTNIPVCLLRGKPRIPFRKCVPMPMDGRKKLDSIKYDEQEQFQLEL